MFVAYTVGLDLIRSLRPIAVQLRSRSSELSAQLEHAATSVVLNIAEGSKRTGRDPRRFYAMARGSASEVRAILDAASAWGWELDTAEARALVERELALLWGLVHGPKRA